jgi:hypothetical protein
VSHVEVMECNGSLTPAQIQAEESGTELLLHTCSACGKRNLYPIKDSGGKWALEPHSAPVLRLRDKNSTGKVCEPEGLRQD